MALDFRNTFLKNFNELLIFNLKQRNCNINMVKKLLAHKVDVNYKDCFLNTSLHYVVQNFSDKLDLIREILNMEGNPNAVNADGNSPLHLAVLKSNVHVVLELIKFGADVHLANKKGNTPLHVAAMRGKPCIIETLLKLDASFINRGNIRENTPLHIAVIHGKPQAAEMLIRHKADVNCINMDGNTPLHMAMIHNKEDMIKPLIQSGADVNCGNKEGNSPFLLSIRLGKSKIIQNLLDSGANVEYRNDKGNTALHLAASLKLYVIIEVLLKFNANVSSPNNDHTTPMHIAAITGNCKLIRKLSDKGAGVDCVDVKGNTPLHLAIIHNQECAIESLIECGAEHICNKKGNTPLHLAVIDGNLDMVRVLLKYGADIDCRDGTLNTPLHLAAILDKPCIVRLLIELGAKTDLVNYNSHTPVQVAALNGNVNIINVLFQNGVRVKLRNHGRRYISSFAQSLIQHSNPAQAATGGNSQPETAAGATGGSNPATQNNAAGNIPSFSQFFDNASHPMHHFATMAPGSNTSNSPAPSTSLASLPFTSFPPVPTPQEVISQYIANFDPAANTDTIYPTVATTTGASTHFASVASTSHAAGSTSSVSSQTVGSPAPANQGTNQTASTTPGGFLSPPSSIIPVVAHTISQLANSMGLPSPPSLGGGINANSFDLLFETEQAIVLGPLHLESPPSLAGATTWGQQITQNQATGGPSQGGSESNVPQQSTYVAFLDELDSEGDPMSWSWSPFLRNSKVEENAIIDNLVKFYGINGRNRSGNRHLQKALISDDPDDIQCFLNVGIANTTSKPNRRENSYLHLAAVYGKPKLVEALIKRGVAIDLKNNELNTPLHFAAFCGEGKIIDVLVRYGASLDLMNRRGATPLKYAFGYCRKSVLKIMGKSAAKRFLSSAKTLVKYDVLKKGLYLTRHKVLKANCVFELLSFVDECCNEVLNMKMKHLARNYSFYQFVHQALTSSESLSKSPHVDAAVNYLAEISKTEYPIYYDFLVFLLTSKLDMSFWQMKLLEFVDKAIDKRRILLDRRLFTSICYYISNLDMFNLLLAVTDNKFEN